MVRIMAGGWPNAQDMHDAMVDLNTVGIRASIVTGTGWAMSVPKSRVGEALSRLRANPRFSPLVLQSVAK